jgi:hypothetical protein
MIGKRHGELGLETQMNSEPGSAWEDLGPTRAISADRGQTQTSICSTKQTENLPSAETRRLVAELGLRYRPSAQADLAAHAAATALLARDVADIDPHYLEQAITEHVSKSPFMPKACELISLAGTAQASAEYWLRFSQRATSGPLPPEPKEEVTPCTPEEADAILKEFGLKANPLDRIEE